MRNPAAISLLGFLTALAASNLAAQKPSDGSACSLLTAAEVSAVLQIHSQDGKPLGSNATCLFATDTGQLGIARSATVTVGNPRAFQSGKQMISKEPVPERSVNGIGDDAYFVGPGRYVKLSVLKGSRAFGISLVAGQKSTETRAQIEELEKALARKAVRRL